MTNAQINMPMQTSVTNDLSSTGPALREISVRNTVADLVTNAAMFTNQNDSMQAVLHLRRALHIMRRQFDNNVTQHGNFDLPASYSGLYLQTASVANSDNSKDLMPVFGSAFLLKFMPSNEGYVQLTIEVAIAAVLYNMALVYHTQVLRTAKSQNATRALRLYKMARSLLEPSFRDHAIDNSAVFASRPDAAILLLSINNNIGHLHATNFEKVEATQCLNKMKDVLQSIGYVGIEHGTFFFLTARLLDDYSIDENGNTVLNLFGVAPVA